jgi:hypothetical protein
VGQGTAEAVARIEETRARLDAEVDELQRRVPPMVDDAKRRTMRIAAGAAGGVVLIVATRLTIRRRRARLRRQDWPEIVAALGRDLNEARHAIGDSIPSDLPAPVGWAVERMTG